MYLLGIDPGQEGAFVLLHESKHIEQFRKMAIIKLRDKKGKVKIHYDVLSIISFIKSVKKLCPNTHVFLEKSQSAPGQGVVSMFSTGYGFGLLVGIIASAGLDYTLVAPKDWKDDMMRGLPREKLASVVAASRLFPQCLPMLQRPESKFPDHNMADALLIAEWGRRKMTTRPTSVDQTHT